MADKSLTSKSSNKLKVHKLIGLAKNENPYGPPLAALDAIRDALHNQQSYPELDPVDLKKKISDKFGVQKENVVVGSGLVHIIDMILKIFIGGDENMITAEVTFLAFKVLATIYGVDTRLVPMKDHAIDLEGIAKSCDDKTRIIFLPNPNNPTGTFFTHEEIRSLLKRVSPNIWVALDEAYIEYVTEPGYPNSLELLKEFPNLLVLRTFSKIYGLAGSRIGFAIGHKSIINQIKRSKAPFSVNSLAITAAKAALDEDDYVRDCSRKNHRERTRLFDGLTKMGFNALPSQGNFLYVSFPTSELKNKVFDNLLENGINVSKLDHFGDSLALRISVGKEEDNRHLLDCLGQMRNSQIN